MRAFLFRGQTRKKGERVKPDGTPVDGNWVYGGIFPQNEEGAFAVIYQQKPVIKKFSVYAETVGQYTGKTDKKGIKIFDGDIAVCRAYGCCGIIQWNGQLPTTYRSGGLQLSSGRNDKMSPTFLEY